VAGHAVAVLDVVVWVVVVMAAMAAAVVVLLGQGVGVGVVEARPARCVWGGGGRRGGGKVGEGVRHVIAKAE
jgi:hypothetical protein